MAVEKTPVAILQELMAKIGRTPKYEIHSISQDNVLSQFMVQVTCEDITTSGSGRSKKEAKHNAAKAMLDEIQNSDLIPLNQTRKRSLKKSTPSIIQAIQSTVTDDIIKKLEELCVKYNLMKPVYKILESSGFNCTWKIQCAVSNHLVIGKGDTHIIAKRNAAQEMIVKVNSLFCTDDNDIVDVTDIDSVNTTNIFKKFQTSVNDKSEKIKTNEDLRIRIERKKLEKYFESFPQTFSLNLKNLSALIKDCKRNMSENSVIVVKQQFQTILESVKIDFHHMLLQTVEPTTFMLMIQLNTDPEILEMSLGNTKEEAELRTINKIVESLKNFLK